MAPISFPSPPRRILIVKPSAIGDVVHGLPVLNLLARRWPGAEISWLVTPACAGLLDGHPMLSEVIRFERRRFGQGWRNPRALWELRQFTRDLRRRRFDLVIDLQGLFRSGWLARKTGAPVRIGLADAREMGWAFYTHRVPVGPGEQHAVARYLKVAAALGCDAGPVEFPFATDAADRRAVADMLAPQGSSEGHRGAAGEPTPFAVLLPGTNWPTKRWPAEHFAELAEALRRRLGLGIVVAGGPGDAELSSRVRGLNLCGRTNLRQLVALLERAALVVANDSGPMHVAAALGRPLVAPFGPTNPVRTGPFGREPSVVRLDIACSPCYSRRCSHQSCLRWLGVEPLLALAAEQMAAPRPNRLPVID